jgi:hypothetical protein
MNPSNHPAPPSPPAVAPRPPRAQALLTCITLEAPLLGVESARLALRCGEDDIMAWIMGGELEWAFDIRRAGARRPCCRILTESVVRQQRREGRLTPREKETQRGHSFPEIFDGIFPHRRSLLFSSELCRVWNCGASHVHNLIQDGLLPPVEKRYAACEAFQFPREKIFAFMQSRRMK